MFCFVNKENTVRFAHFTCDFIWLYLFVLTFAINLKYGNYKSRVNILVTNEKWCQMWIYSIEKCLILFHFHYLSSLWSWNGEISILKFTEILYIFFDKRTIWRQIWICPMEKCLIFHFHCLGSLYSWNWEISILKVIKIL